MGGPRRAVTGREEGPEGHVFGPNAVRLDASGAIVGGGYTVVDFAPAGGQTAVSVSYTGAKPATVVLHAQLTNLSN